MNDDIRGTHCTIVGAGLSGLVAGTRLQEAGLDVIIVEGSSHVGGRLKAVEMQFGTGPASIFDSGAQFFTVREPLFSRMVDSWLTKGLVQEWSRGFATADGSYYEDGHSRYRGVPDMAGLARDLARDLDCRLSHKVLEVARSKSGWVVTYEDGHILPTDSVILTPPVPQSLALLDSGNTALTNLERARLEKIDYEPCIALLVQLDGPGQLPRPGGMWSLGEPVAWLADNYLKGVSPLPGAFTIHAGPEFSLDHWQTDEATVTSLLLDAVDPWLGEPVLGSQVLRWLYSKPYWLYPEPFLSISGGAPLILAGDAFAGPRVEGAALSGLAAADFLLSD